MVPPAKKAPAKKAATSRSGPKARTWHEARPAPVVLVTGPEGLLVDRATRTVIDKVRAEHQQVEVTTIEAAGYESGALGVLASPSLFEEHRVVVLSGMAEANEAAVTDVLAYYADPQPDVVLVVRHSGGVRAKKIVDEGKKAPGCVLVECPAAKRVNDQLSFLSGEFERAERTISSQAAHLLVEALGSDLRELAAGAAQLMADVPGDVDVDDVRRYYGGRAEASGFEVADAVVARDHRLALLRLRQALDAGVDPIPLLAAIAAKIRSLAKVSVASGSGGQAAKELGMPPWMVDQARRSLQRWTPAELAAVIADISDADVALKGGVEVGQRVLGGTQDPVYTLERLVLRACGGQRTGRSAAGGGRR